MFGRIVQNLSIQSQTINLFMKFKSALNQASKQVEECAKSYENKLVKLSITKKMQQT